MSQDKIERWNEVDGNLDNSEKMQAFLDSTTCLLYTSDAADE